MDVKLSKWNENSKLLLKKLHGELSINNKNWHQQKSDKQIRAAELLVGALSQLINEGDETNVKELLRQALKWLDNEIKDPGCPSH